jgi:hypothetical protein
MHIIKMNFIFELGVIKEFTLEEHKKVTNQLFL